MSVQPAIMAKHYGQNCTKVHQTACQLVTQCCANMVLLARMSDRILNIPCLETKQGIRETLSLLTPQVNLKVIYPKVKAVSFKCILSETLGGTCWLKWGGHLQQRLLITVKIWAESILQTSVIIYCLLTIVNTDFYEFKPERGFAA